MISILMGIYNCADTLSDAIDSIINQTYTNWELIMCDDGSIDGTYNIAQNYAMKDNRMILLKNKKNIGLNKTLNKCFSIAQGDYIGRMDGDDICDSMRFEEELAVLESESNIAIVSTAMNFFDNNGIWGRDYLKEYPQKKDFAKGTPINHAPSMFRREAFEAVNGYSEFEILKRCEDYHLWAKMYTLGYRAKNINKTLYSMRDDYNAYVRRTFKGYINSAKVSLMILKMLNLPWYYYIYALRPIITAFMPTPIYNIVHRKRLSSNRKK